MRKVAVQALQKPNDPSERVLFWKHLEQELDGGVRGWWAYGLLQDALKAELERWIGWIKDENWSVRWCVSNFLSKYPEFPKLDMSPDPELISAKALPVLQWYEDYTKESSS